jgi:hypothetical protein
MPHAHTHPQVCKNCGTKTTPFWRKDKHDGKPLCNACGLYFSKNDAPRPKSLWKAEEGCQMDGVEGEFGNTGPSTTGGGHGANGTSSMAPGQGGAQGAGEGAATVCVCGGGGGWGGGGGGGQGVGRTCK